MPINFEQAAIRQPKIDIIGKEVPLAALEKTGDVLQGKFDKSYENYSLADEALKQMESRANPIDREKAKELRSQYTSEMKGILEAGDFHNMRHQTSALARNAAANYGIIEQRNKELEAAKAAILNDKRYTRDKDKRVADFMALQKSVGFDPNTRTVTDANVTPWSGVENIDAQKLALSYGTTMKPITIGNKTGTIRYEDAAGNPTDAANAINTFHVTSEGEKLQLKKEDVAKAVKKAMLADQGLQADINQDLAYEFREGKYKGIDPNSPEGQMITQKHVDDFVTPFADNAGGLLRQYQKSTGSDKTLYGSPDNLGRGSGSETEIPQFTQVPSAIFSQNKPTDPFKVDADGNINYDKPTTKGINFVRDEFGVRDPNAANLFTTNGKMDLNKFENSVSYKRLKTHLTKLGVIGEGSSKKDTNLAIVNFWNQLGNAESSIAVAKPGDEKANKYLDEVNKTYFGDKSPDNPAKGTSIKSGQLAQRTFTDENGKHRSSQEVFNDTKNRNVRVNGWVNQIESPFEYGSHYMVATDPESGETKNYLIEPDINTKNSGAYFANRIFNSTRDKELKTSWKDGNGTDYEATPIEGGNKFALYIGKDVKTPLILDQNDLQAISQLPAGQANQVIMNFYNSRK